MSCAALLVFWNNVCHRLQSFLNRWFLLSVFRGSVPWASDTNVESDGIHLGAYALKCFANVRTFGSGIERQCQCRRCDRRRSAQCEGNKSSILTMPSKLNNIYSINFLYLWSCFDSGSTLMRTLSYAGNFWEKPWISDCLIFPAITKKTSCCLRLWPKVNCPPCSALNRWLYLNLFNQFKQSTITFVIIYTYCFCQLLMIYYNNTSSVNHEWPHAGGKTLFFLGQIVKWRRKHMSFFEERSKTIGLLVCKSQTMPF
jgi:hypothetical protein